MSDSKLEDLVEDIVAEFIHDNKLFTALDVSNKVKETMPMVRHRDTRDVVRNSWFTLIEPFGYGKTPISVTLTDGSVTQAILYHPDIYLDPSDLDADYDAQKRAQMPVRPTTNVVVPQPVATPTTATVINDPVATPVVMAAVVSQPKLSPRDMWTKLFSSAPSLFPKR